MENKFFILISSLIFLTCQNLFSIDQNKFVILITSYNNAEWYERNLSSVFFQEYQNYRVIYCDDCSSDGTASLVEDYIKEYKQESRVILLKNEEWQSQLANQYRATHMCDDNEIIVILDGDDWFAHPNVLHDLNEAYKDPDVWVTHGRMEFYPEKNNNLPFREIPKEIITTNTFRESHGKPGGYALWNWWHPRTYYAWLAKQVKLGDLLHESSFKTLNPSPDSAYMYPILEMSAFHTKFISSVAYVKNKKNPISQGKIDNGKQIAVNRLIASWKKYNFLPFRLKTSVKTTMDFFADIVVFSDNVLEAKKFITSCFQNVSNFDSIFVLMQSENKEIIMEYEELKNISDKIEVFNLHNMPLNYIIIDKIIPNLKEYIIFADTSKKVILPIDLSSAIIELEKTFALGVYFSLNFDSDQAPGCASISNNFCAWQFKYTKDTWSKPYNFEITLYKKSKILNSLKKIKAKSLKDFVNRLGSLNLGAKRSREIGLASLNRCCE